MYMLPHDLLSAIIPTYPPEGTDMERAGFLDGEELGVGLLNGMMTHSQHDDR